MYSATLALLVSLPGIAHAFLRSNDTTSPLDNSFTTYGPNINMTNAMLGRDQSVNSYWYTAYAAAEDGHDYFVVACHSYSANLSEINTYVSLYDVDTQEYYGTNVVVPARIPTTTYDIDGGGLRVYGSTPDLVSTQHAISTIPGAAFNLTFEPRGPNLYHAGSGIHYWGDGTTSQIAHPQLWVTGTLSINGSDVAIIPEQSSGWMDRQWGTGYAFNGWYFFNVFLENGLVIAAWRTYAIDDTPKLSAFATVLFPDGQNQVHAIDPDLQERNPFVTPNNNTYYTDLNFNIPTLDLYLNVRVPVGVGEMAEEGNPGGSTTLYEAYALYSGTLEGDSIKGFGLVERTFQFDFV